MRCFLVCHQLDEYINNRLRVGVFFIFFLCLFIFVAVVCTCSYPCLILRVLTAHNYLGTLSQQCVCVFISVLFMVIYYFM